MATGFADLTFTASVTAAQVRYGGRAIDSGDELSAATEFGLTAEEIEFISERDSFYQATVSETGWPYVQHRGGPKGFLKVLDEQTIGYADFRGNRQYLSVGNLNADNRISMILINYPKRQRLKLWGRARIVHENEDAELIAQLQIPAYRARVERGIVIQIAAGAWNCPQHITQRYSKAEIEQLLTPLQMEIQALKAQLARSAPST